MNPEANGRGERWGDPRFRPANPNSDPTGSTSSNATTVTPVAQPPGAAFLSTNNIPVSNPTYCRPNQADNDAATSNRDMSPTRDTNNMNYSKMEEDDENDQNDEELTLEEVCRQQEFELIDQVEWAGSDDENDTNYDRPKLAKRPKPDFVSDPCMCEMPEEEARASSLLTYAENYFSKHIPMIVVLWMLGITVLILRFLGSLAYIERLKHYKTEYQTKKHSY